MSSLIGTTVSCEISQPNATSERAKETHLCNDRRPAATNAYRLVGEVDVIASEVLRVVPVVGVDESCSKASARADGGEVS